MTPTAIFHNDDADDAFSFLEEYPFATIAVNGDDGPVTALVPLVMNDERDMLLGHVARANPFWSIAQRQSGKAVAVFRGPDAYVSPSNYPSKIIHGKVVPTWNYLAVEIRGIISVETDAAKMMPFINLLTEKMESHREVPWQVGDAPEAYIAKLSRAIVGFKIQIEDFTFVQKISQNKSRDDQKGVVAGLKSSDVSNERIIAEKMMEKMEEDI